MHRYNIKLTISMNIVAENSNDAQDCINELDYNFLETSGKAFIERFEMADSEILEIQPLTKKELKQYV
jgi:hypothetical protein